MMQQASATDPAPGRRPELVPDPDAETARIAAVRRYDILDTPPDGAFDRVAAMAARLFDVPVATVTIVDTDRIWFKAAHGLEGVKEIGRDPGLCGSAILRDDTMVIPDTLQDSVAADNPLVAGEMGVRFYAAAPIITPDGHRLGTVNVLDTRPRSITEDDTATLADLAAIVLDEMELRLSALRALRHEQERREAESRHAEAERARAEAERAAREQAEQDKAAIAAFASTLQRTLLPPALPVVPGLELACHYRTASAHDVGGDFYDVFPLDGGRWAFFLGDVCGKGPEAATVTALARHTLRAAAQINPDPVTVLRALNTMLLTDVTAGSRFCTALFGLLEPREGSGFTVTIATGGHPPAYHVRPDDSGAVWVKAVRPKGGMLVGAFPQAPFVQTTFSLTPGESLFLYTDGLTEARTTQGAMLGEDGLTGFLHQRTGSVTAASLVEDTVTLLASLPDGAGDDVALLALSVPGPQAAPDSGVAATAHTAAAPEHIGQE
ncbi:SpoIIE family protein phosphatase [Streptomyces sp. 5-8]|uniref:SpoIIE family protein phosphatase n=1 Tax=Streptomyces musisoli TaxID=2802280 RepID=A0ABS1PE60_9ACTN|nr:MULTISPECIES: GAF domain-containing SpoIIE family protein phosphatase [Streptomyces]MBL1110347.1 SpoIIE family protein phosphatase [Streptomyces musisoli]MBY8846635.1 SpoIIE family protein phosphatase [Streptomyces sp. SP2-10]